ncbi:MAG: trehalose-6-phosphate synthase, partial [Myxococcales bacterium]|nr:trehalose-6-phosphate synthase [Myxococcales bacterium]
ITIGERVVKVIAAPIGTPTADLDRLARDPAVCEEAAAIRARVAGRKIILGVDRLDYTKGIPERLLGYERFLRRGRQTHHDYVFVQVMVPSRTDVRAYSELKSEVDRMVGSINGSYGDTGLVPIHYLYTNLDQKTLFAHYRAADVALVSPLRDGMNLVAHEYVLSRTENDGVLVLSEFAGAAEHFKDALSVNPYDLDGIADALTLAFNLEDSDRKRRMIGLRKKVIELDVHRWAARYLEALG